MATLGYREWNGIFPAALTIFDDAGRIDEDATATHLDRLITEGAHGLVVAGTSGEFILLDDAERRRVIELAVQTSGGRVPVIAGTGYASTDATIAMTEHAAKSGADAAIVILPYYLRPTEQEVLQHFIDVGRASPIPIIVYNNPANSAAPELSVPQLHDLYEQGLIAGVKSTFPTVHQIHELKAEIDAPFRAFYGSFVAPMEAMAGGADGWISGILNVVTPHAVSMWHAIQRGDLVGARRIWRDILPIKQLYSRRVVGSVSDLALYRAILNLRGAVGGSSRRPIQDLDAAQLDQLRAYLGGTILGPVAQPASRRR